MRTTIDLPAELHASALQIARDRHQTLSRTVADLMRTAMTRSREGAALPVDPQTGFPLVSVGTAITAEDVAAAAED